MAFRPELFRLMPLSLFYRDMFFKTPLYPFLLFHASGVLFRPFPPHLACVHTSSAVRGVLFLFFSQPASPRCSALSTPLTYRQFGSLAVGFLRRHLLADFFDSNSHPGPVIIPSFSSYPQRPLPLSPLDIRLSPETEASCFFPAPTLPPRFFLFAILGSAFTCHAYSWLFGFV